MNHKPYNISHELTQHSDGMAMLRITRIYNTRRGRDIAERKLLKRNIVVTRVDPHERYEYLDWLNKPYLRFMGNYGNFELRCYGPIQAFDKKMLK